LQKITEEGERKRSRNQVADQ